MLTNLAICCTGDLICQAISRKQDLTSLKKGKQKEWDLGRTGRFGAVGAIVQTNLMHWYLTRVVPILKFSHKTFPTTKTRHFFTTTLRLGVHLTFMMPFRIGVIFLALYTLQHKSFMKGLASMKANFSDGLRAAYLYWPLVLLGLYTLVPWRYGNLYYDSFNLIWAVALSYISSQDNLAIDTVQGHENKPD